MIVVALHQLGVPGLVTSNYKMLKNPKELAAIVATKLTVFAIEGVGDDPIRATGALLLDRPGALKRMDSRKRRSSGCIHAIRRLKIQWHYLSERTTINTVMPVRSLPSWPCPRMSYRNRFSTARRLKSLATRSSSPTLAAMQFAGRVDG